MRVHGNQLQLFYSALNQGMLLAKARRLAVNLAGLHVCKRTADYMASHVFAAIDRMARLPLPQSF